MEHYRPLIQFWQISPRTRPKGRKFRSRVSPSMRRKTTRSYRRSPRHRLYFLPPLLSPLLHTSHIADVIILGRDRWKKTNTSRFKIFYSWRLHFACAATAEINCSPVACRDRRVACSSITIDFAWEHYEEAEKALVGGVLLPPTISKISILFQPTSFRPCLPF